MNKMILFWITLVLALIGTNAEGEFYVLYSPSSLSFIRTDDTYESLLKEIFCAALGLSVEKNAEWKGMYVMDPFNTPEAVVEVYIDGVASLGEYAGLKSKVFPLVVDEYEPDTFKGVKRKIRQRLDFGDNKIVNIKLSDENKLNTINNNVFGNVNVTSYKAKSAGNLIHLKQTVEEDRHFISELSTLEAIIEKVQTGALVHDNLIDFYSFRFRNLHALSDLYGPISRQTEEAKKLLGDALLELSKAFVKAYDGSVLVTAVTTDVAHTRRSARSLTNRPGHSKKGPYQSLEPPFSRQKMSFKPADARRDEGSSEVESTASDEGESGGISTTTDITTTENLILIKQDSGPIVNFVHTDAYAPMFIIFLLVGALFIFSMLAIVYFLMDMDPGRDTIIYRMTTMRTKKDL